uniref:Hyaluronidase n=1 Tax=Ascaris lumbricoides TaxID=6252 RepID=A0A0M3I4C2_ASCLU
MSLGVLACALFIGNHNDCDSLPKTMRHRPLPTQLLLVLFSAPIINSQRDRFEVLWNVPSRNCFRQHIDIPLKKFGIIFNDKQEFHGNRMNTFYEKNIGLYPYYKDGSDPKSIVNGGIPQRVNMVAHLRKAQKDIESAIPDSGFGGVAVLDFEAWRPLWSLNWGSKRIYKSESVKFVRQRYPELSNKAARQMATKEFNKAAFNLMVETIRLGIRLRPFARWGFYGFPYCNYDAGKKGEYECSETFKQYNDRLALILQEATALFPSIYLSSETETDRNFRYIQAVIREAKRVSAKFEPKKPVFAYTKMAYNPYKDPHHFYLKRDICNSVKQCSDLGIQGIIIWSTSQGMNSSRCRHIATYVNEHYGPYVEIVRKHAERCSQKRCLGRGQCVLQPQMQCASYNEQAEYNCECDALFFGRHCERHRNFPWLYDWKWLRKNNDD